MRELGVRGVCRSIITEDDILAEGCKYVMKKMEAEHTSLYTQEPVELIQNKGTIREHPVRDDSHTIHKVSNAHNGSSDVTKVLWISGS